MNNRICTLIALTLALGVSACATPGADESRLEREFGLSVREMVELQTADPGAAERNGAAISEGIDGEMAGEVLEVYRTDVSKPAESGDQIIFTVGE